MIPDGTLQAAIRKAAPLRQVRVIITPWKSGHCTVDVVSRRIAGGSHWDRRSGHLDLPVSPDRLEGLTTAAILRLLCAELSPVDGD